MAEKGKFVITRFEIAKDGDMETFLDSMEKFAKTNKIKYNVMGGIDKGGKLSVQTPNKELEILMNLGDTEQLEIPDYAPLEYTQTGIAENVDLDVSVISRYLKNLRQRKLVKSKTMNIIGDVRRRRVYFLTKRGRDLLNQLFETK